MTNLVSEIDKCRLCNSKDFEKVISLGQQYITSRFPSYGNFNFPKIPVDLCLCHTCGLLQMFQTTLSEELYGHEYGYRSGISNTMRKHLLEYNKEILSTVVELTEDDMILDIGSNDSTMLNFYPEKYKNIVGIDPTGFQFKEYYTRAKLIANYFTKENYINEFGIAKKCKIVSSISMFYDLPDPVAFAEDIYEILHDDGIWTCEQSYLMSMLKRNSIDTICHEHLEYYALKQIKIIADLVGFKIINVLFNDCNGGSFRIYFSKKKSNKYKECVETTNKILKEETEYGLYNVITYKRFIESCDCQVKKLKDFLHNVNENGKNTYIYGASTKGNCLLQYGNIGENYIKYAVERNLQKVGKMTNTGIEIIDEETMRKEPPDFLLVLPYHFKEEIINREHEFLKNGGQLIFPLPELEIVGYSKKVLITGCEGHIAKYVKELLHNEYCLYGIGHKNKCYEKESKILKYYFDICDYAKLENVLDTIRPDIVIHLASISNSSVCFENPIKTIETNGLVTAKLCDIIYRNKMDTILFNASSSEMYKGHNIYFIEEDDTNKYHLHPYSISKIMGHNMIDFYRNNYGLKYYNGVFFTIESKYKQNTFLLNKVSLHASKWKETKEILSLGSLGSYRNILHAYDASKAIEKIIKSNKPGNYLICNENNHKVFDLVESIYKLCDIHLFKKNKDGVVFYYDKKTNLPVINIVNENKGYDTCDTDIDGRPIKLKALGWKPIVKINDILCEILGSKYI